MIPGESSDVYAMLFDLLIFCRKLGTPVEPEHVHSSCVLGLCPYFWTIPCKYHTVAVHWLHASVVCDPVNYVYSYTLGRNVHTSNSGKEEIFGKYWRKIRESFSHIMNFTCIIPCVFRKCLFKSTTSFKSGQCVHWIRRWAAVLCEISASIVPNSSWHILILHVNNAGCLGLPRDGFLDILEQTSILTFEVAFKLNCLLGF